MTVRAALVLLSLLGAGAAAGAAAPAGGDALSVTYRTQTAVYLSGGRRAGLAVRDRLAVMDEGRQVALLEVTFVAEHSSSARVVEQARPVRVGDRVVRLSASRPEPEVVTSPSAAPVAPGVPRARADAPPARLTGGASAGWWGFRDRSQALRHVDERMARYVLSARGVGGQPLELTLRGSNRRSERQGRRATVIPQSERFDRLYEASVAWTPADGRYSVRGGRLGASPFTALGYLDGALAELRATAGVLVGAFAGRTAQAQDFGLDEGSKYGAFLRVSPRAGPVPYGVLLTGVVENGGLGRRYVGQEGHARAGGLWLHERVEVDFGTAPAGQAGGGGARLSEARLLATWRPSDARALSVSYERRRPLWGALPAGVFASAGEVQQTLRAELDFTRRGGGGPWLGGSLRTGEGDGRRAFSVHAGARSPDVYGLAASAEASAYQTLYTRGFGGFLRAGRDLRGGHGGQLSYLVNVYELRLAGATRLHHAVRLSGYGRLTRGVYARADLEYGMGDDVRGTRVMVEAGYRF